MARTEVIFPDTPRRKREALQRGRAYTKSLGAHGARSGVYAAMQEQTVREGSVALVAFGGNVILRDPGHETMADQAENCRRMCGQLMAILRRGYELVVTHGNGPQVGNLLVQNEVAKHMVPALPLDVLVANTEGSLGYLLQRQLLNELQQGGMHKNVVTLITQVLVDGGDPAFQRPTKPVGPFYSKQDAEELAARFPDWVMAEDANRGYRRMVASPIPKRILQSGMVRALTYAGHVVLALGGGGVPTIQDAQGQLHGVEAVIDKDLSSAMLALDVKADLFIILTGVDRVCLHYGTPQEIKLDTITFVQAREYTRAGHFPEGSMGPKIASALLFLEGGGREVLITSPEKLDAALEGRAGTRIVWK